MSKIDKNNRFYIETDQKLNEGDIIEFEMPPFCSGDYQAEVYIDNDGDPYIDKNDNYFEGCRDFSIIKR
jgi:hypothetical protein